MTRADHELADEGVVSANSRASAAPQRGFDAKARLIAALVVGVALRLLGIWEQDAFLHPDATWQGFEPAFGVVWEGYEKSWEFEAGVRSWVWPTWLALPNFMLAALGLAGPGEGMALALFASRCMCVALELLACVLAVTLVHRAAGELPSLLVAVLLALSPAFVVPSSQGLIDTPASLALLWAWWCAWPSQRVEGSDERPQPAHPRRSGVWVGVSLALAFMLRVQLAPALLVLAAGWLWRLRSESSSIEQAKWGALGAFAIVVAFGAVDALTWGGWWHSLRTYLAFNLSEQGMSFGTMPADRYWVHFELALPYLRWPLLGLAVMGAIKRPGWGLLALAFWLPHQLLSYRVWRFIQPGLFVLVVLAGLGIGALLEHCKQRMPRINAWIVATVALAFVTSSVTATMSASLWQTTWAYDQGGEDAVRDIGAMNRAALWLSTQPDPGVVINQLVPYAGAPGRALFGHAGPRVHLLSGQRLTPGQRAGAWIVPAQAEAQVRASKLRVAWRDPQGVCLVLMP